VAAAHPVIGLTGLPGAGKSTAARILQETGAHVIDVDRIGHRLLEESSVRAALVRRFGDGILNDSGVIDRTALGRIVFAEPRALADLERLLHPAMTERVREEVARERRNRPVVIDAALLVPMGLDALADRLLVVEAPAALRRERLRRERNWTEEETARREARLADTERTDFPRADAVVANDGTRAELADRLNRIWKDWTHAPEESGQDQEQGQRR
jgi:dephospho-CoA kinase